MKEVFFSEKYSDRAKDVLKLLNGMTISEAQEMLHWCSDFVTSYTTVNWEVAAENQKRDS